MNNRIIAMTVSAIFLFLSGCAGMADATSRMAGLGVVSEEQSTFDNARIIKVSPTFLYDPDGSWGNSVKLGARWSSNAPDYVVLVLSHSSDTSGGGDVYVNLSGIDINVDGDIQSFESGSLTDHDSSDYNTVTNTIYTESNNSVVIPMSVLRSMVSSSDCRVRIHTSAGYEDAVFSIERMPGGQGTAILSIREFLSAIGTS